MNFFDRRSIDSVTGKPYKVVKYESIVADQTLISYLTGMTYYDTESMTPFERDKILDNIKIIKASESGSCGAN